MTEEAPEVPDDTFERDGQGDDGPPGGALAVARDRMWASARALVVAALLLAAVLQDPGSVGPLVFPLLALPYAFVTARYGYRPALSVGLGLLAAGVLLGVEQGAPLAGLALGVMMGGTVGGAGAVLGGVAQGRRFERWPLAATTAAFVAVTLVPLLLYGIAAGEGTLRAEGQRQVTRYYGAQLDAMRCDRKDPSERVVAMCDQYREQRDVVNDGLREAFVPIVAVLATLGAWLTAISALLAFRIVAVKWKLPVARPRSFLTFRAHWGNAYLLAFGLALVMAAWRAGDDDGLLMAAGASAAALAGMVFLLQGVSLASWYMRQAGLRPMTRVIVWLVMLLTWRVSLGFLVSVAIIDTFADIRARKAGRIGRPDDER